MPPKLNKEQIDLFREVFLIYERGNQTVETKELEQMLQSLGINPTQQELEGYVNEVDSDGNGTIDFDEFCDLMANEMKKAKKQNSMREVFNLMDDNGSGYLGPSELRAVMRSLGEKLTDEEIGEMIDEADEDGDGLVSYSDFLYIIKAVRNLP